MENLDTIKKALSNTAGAIPKKNSAQDDWRNGNVAERLCYALATNMITDCTFLVGTKPDKREEVPAHKFILSLASPVFEAMFHGGLAEEGVVTIEGIEPHFFRKMLMYIYTDDVELKNVENAIGVCYAGNRYLLANLCTKCILYIRKNVNVTNVCKVFEFARYVCNAPLEAQCMLFIQENTEAILDSDGFLEAEPSTIQAILEQEELDVTSELEIFLAVMRWAKHHTEGTDNLREIVGPKILSLFRFRSISSNDFAIQVCPIKLLDASEERDVLCCLAVPQCPMPIGLSKEIKQRTKYVKPVEPVEIKEMVNVNYSTFYGFSFIRSILGNRIQGFSSKFDAYILGVKVRGMRYTPRNPGPPPKYIEKFQVTIKSKDNEAMGTYQGELSTGHAAEVMFETPYFAPANTFHAMFVRYAQPNIQSFSYLYRSHELRTKSDKIFEIWSEYSHIVAVMLTQKQNFHLYQESLNKVETVTIAT